MHISKLKEEKNHEMINTGITVDIGKNTLTFVVVLVIFYLRNEVFSVCLNFTVSLHSWSLCIEGNYMQI